MKHSEGFSSNMIRLGIDNERELGNTSATLRELCAQMSREGFESSAAFYAAVANAMDEEDAPKVPRPINCNRRVTFGPIDRLNPGIGYQLRIVNADTGATILSTASHPSTGKPLDFHGCIEVLDMYDTPRLAATLEKAA